MADASTPQGALQQAPLQQAPLQQVPIPQGPNTSQAADPLAQLRDIHLPAPIEAWPPAPGWWLLVIVATGLVCYGLNLLYQHWRRNQYRREGIKSLHALKVRYNEQPNSFEYLEAYNELLKRIALSHFRRELVASLTGESWVAFLDKTGATREFSMGPGQVLIQGNYLPQAEYSVDELHDIGLAWIRNHSDTTFSPERVSLLASIKDRWAVGRLVPNKSVEQGL